MQPKMTQQTLYLWQKMIALIGNFQLLNPCPRLLIPSPFFFFFIWVLRPFQEYFTYIEPIVHQRWAKTGEPGEKPPDHP